MLKDYVNVHGHQAIQFKSSQGFKMRRLADGFEIVNTRGDVVMVEHGFVKYYYPAKQCG